MVSRHISSPGHRVRAVLAAGAATAALASAAPASASDAAAAPANGATGNAIVQPGGIYEIVTFQSSPSGYKCVDVPRASITPGERLQISRCHGSDRNGANQLFAFVDTGDAYYEVQNVNSNQCLNLPDTAGAEGTQLEQRDCVGLESERWRVFAYDVVGNGPVIGLASRTFANQCVTWQGGATPADGNKLVITSCRRSQDPPDPKQMWWLG